MIQRIIEWSLKNRFLVFCGALLLIALGVRAVFKTPVDAIPDLTENQVLVYADWMGRSPQEVEDQVTYPLSTGLQGLAGVKDVRAVSMFGFSLLTIIFEEDTDTYFARTRVLERLNYLQGAMPEGVKPQLGPDATGLGWVYQYYLDVDASKAPDGGYDLGKLRTVQDWHIRYQLASVQGVAEVASIGGFVKQYQIELSATKMRAANVTVGEVMAAVQNANLNVGGKTIEENGAEFVLRGIALVESTEDLELIPIKAMEGTPIYINDIATVQIGGDFRRGALDIDGHEAVGGTVVMRTGENAKAVIERVKEKIAQISKSLPPGISIKPFYDRSTLIERTIDTLKHALIEEIILVTLAHIIFLWHFRSILIVTLPLPVSILISFLLMKEFGITSNIMSLGGIAIAIGAMVDAVIIMIENAHKHIEHDGGKKPHWQIIRDASIEVGPTLFYSLLVITVSFIPVFTLQAQEGRMFKPLAFTKTYSMAAAALLSITLAPILMGFFIRGKVPPEEKNPINRALIWLYHPLIDWVIRWRWQVIIGAATVIVWVFFPWNWAVTSRLPDGSAKAFAAKVGRAFPFQNLGSEFMPPLYEGDLLYMPTTFPGISPTKAREILQQTDKIIRSFGEVHHVFGKIGRAETATDPAPFDMVETTIMLKDEKDWPVVDIKDASGKVFAHRRRTADELVDALNAAIQIPGLNNAWTMPIKTRIDMLATGIKTPVGIKVAGASLAELERVASEIEVVVRQVPGTSSVFAERVMGGNYIEFHINRDEIARYGLTVGAAQDVLEVALGGMPLTTTVEGLERYSVNLRYDRDFRENLEALREIIVPTPTGAQVPLGQLAKVEVVRAPMGIKSEGAVPNAWIYVDVKNIDVGTYVQMAQRAVNEAVAKGAVKLPSGFNIIWSGQYEYMLRAKQRLLIVVPLTLLIIILIIYLNTRSAIKTAIVLLAVPFSLVGAFWILYLLDYNLSVAVWVGIIALAGLDAETGVVMLLYLDLAYEQWTKDGKMRNVSDLRDAIYHGAVKRVRPKAMTACVIIAGLLPILWSHGAGADVMKRIATPMIGGVITSTVMELVVYPAIFFLWRSHRFKTPPTTAPIPVT